VQKCAELEPLTSRAVFERFPDMIENYHSEGTLFLLVVSQLMGDFSHRKSKINASEGVAFHPPAALFSCSERVGAKVNVVWTCVSQLTDLGSLCFSG